jgi:hypothetical protein
MPLGSTHPPLQCVLVPLYDGLKRPQREADIHPHLMLNLRMSGAIAPLSHARLSRGASLSTRKTCIALHPEHERLATAGPLALLGHASQQCPALLGGWVRIPLEGAWRSVFILFSCCPV